MRRAAAYSAATVLCAIWLSGCDTLKPVIAAATPSAPAAKSGAAKSDAAAGTAPTSAAQAQAAAKPAPTTDNLDDEIRNAQALRAKGDYDGAVRALAQLMLIAPDNARIIGEYGKVLVQQGRAQESLPFLKRAVQLQPGEWSLYSAMGVAFDQTDDRSAARTAYQHALSLKPGEPSVLNNFAVSRMLAGDYAGARKLLAQAEAEGAANPKIAANLAALTNIQSPAAAAHQTSIAAPVPGSAPAKPAGEAVVVQPLPQNTVAVVPTKVAAGAVVTQRVPQDPQAGPVAPKASDSAKVASSVAKTNIAISTTATPNQTPATVAGNHAAVPAKMLAGAVVMQRVPQDPQAGPVAPKTSDPAKLASSVVKTNTVISASSSQTPANVAVNHAAPPTKIAAGVVATQHVSKASQAEPAAPKTAPAHIVANATKPKTVAKAASAPALRTASELN